ncbi:DUF1552 domain-containing protein [Calycomorphotria hydatis]|uniref:DUF1552 domain-containing protein n=1 Tax=Calycomorphotria hydatis TaxID=2528027 RepID=A0A517T5I1_9PLAN|nr:DUF1552 domain-containing protein [Calycomorphotria hydatis]QDT63618.1 hypothetical protein V22_08420 [Calycomorphotria hydatis]
MKSYLNQLAEFDRRQFLRAGAATIALPSLEAFAASKTPDSLIDRPHNFVAIGTYLGWHPQSFFPKGTGAGYELSPILQPLSEHRDHFTVFSGLDHRAPNGHKAWSNFLCGETPDTYSLDQLIVDHIGGDTRFPSLQLTAGKGEGAKAMSFTERGIGLPMIQRPSVLYKQLFISEADRARSEYLLRSGNSSLDFVLEEARRIQPALSKTDRRKLDEYFDSVRSVENRISRQLKSIDEPIPETDYKLPNYDPVAPNLLIEAEQIMYDLMVLAIDSGSTHVQSLFLDGLGQVLTFDGEPLKAGYHALSHHGNNPAMIHDLVMIEQAHMKCLSNFLQQMKDKKTAQGKSLLDDTIVLLGTGMGDASRHSNSNLPTLVAGGGFQHGQHLAIDRKQKNAPLLGDLYLTLMQKLGIEVDQFSNADRNLNQLFS